MELVNHRTKVIGFVPIYRSPSGAGYEHVRETTIRCRFPFEAEHWLDGLVSLGMYHRWEPATGSDGAAIEYRGARVFRVFPKTERRRRRGDMSDADLVAIWESSW